MVNVCGEQMLHPAIRSESVHMEQLCVIELHCAENGLFKIE